MLRKPTEDITPESLDLKQLLEDMWDTLAVAEGCGLAAPQIGKAIRLFIVDGTELAEDYPDTVELMDALEILLLNRGIALKKVQHELSKLKKLTSKETMIA